MHALALKLAAHRLPETSQAALGRGVAGVEGHTHLRDAGGDVHHHRIAGTTQLGQGAPRQQDRCDQIHFDHRPQLGLGGVFQPPGAHAAGVVDQQVNSAQQRHRLTDQGISDRPVRDVAGDAVHLRVRCLVQRRDSGGQRLRTPSGQRQARAFQRHLPRDLVADAAGAAGDDDALTLHLHEWCPGSRVDLEGAELRLQ